MVSSWNGGRARLNFAFPVLFDVERNKKKTTKLKWDKNEASQKKEKREMTKDKRIMYTEFFSKVATI